MKIVDVQTSLMHGINRNWLFVKIITDEGVYGWGEGTLELHEHAVEQAVKALMPRIIGRDPTQIEKLWQAMYRHGFWRGGPVIGSALSAIDQALWDITGKVYNQPVYKLLGGAVRDRVRAYTHAEDLRGAREKVDQGFTAFKTGGWDTSTHIFQEEKGPEVLREKIRRLRKEVGPDVDIMIDNHGRDRASIAIKKIAAVEEFGLLFFEEATPPDNLDALDQVRKSGVKTDLATGERLYFRWGFKDLIQRRLVDVIQPDICHAGGISELRRISTHAEMEYIKVAPHNPNGPVACAASVQLCAAIPNFLILETARDMPWHDKVQKTPLKIKDGYFELPTTPGLGIDLDEAVIKSRPFEPHTYRGSWDERDGAVADV